jgi:hypothetical protein
MPRNYNSFTLTGLCILDKSVSFLCSHRFRNPRDGYSGSSYRITPGETYVELAPVLAYRFPKRLITRVG